jgi:hypothetical protein
MVSIFSRLFEYVTEPPVRLPTGLAACALDRALELADAAVEGGVPGRGAPSSTYTSISTACR